MTTSVLRALLPVATLAFAAAVLPEIHFSAPWRDSGSAFQVPGQTKPPGQTSTSQPPASLRPSVASCQDGGAVPAAKEPRLQASLLLLPDQTVKADFGSRVSKAYFVIEASISNAHSSGFAITGLELLSADGCPISVTSPKTIAAKVPHRPKLVPEWLLGQECLIPKWFTGQEILVPSSSGVPTRLFVQKDSLNLVEGRLPPGLQLVGWVSETLFVPKAIRATY